jgi:hypothetical protein
VSGGKRVAEKLEECLKELSGKEIDAQPVEQIIVGKSVPSR